MDVLQTLKMTVQPSIVDPLPAVTRAHIAHYQDAARSVNTRRDYGVQIGNFDRWCARHGLSSTLPVPADLIAGWIADRAANGTARATVDLGLAAIKAAHRDIGLAVDEQAISALIKGVRRSLNQPQRQAAALYGPELAALLESQPHSLRDLRNAALIGISYGFALRRSELAALDFNLRGDGAAVLQSTPTALELTVYSAKSSSSTQHA